MHLDATVLLTEWETLPEGKRLPGVLAALGAGVAGIAILARRGSGGRGTSA